MNRRTHVALYRATHVFYPRAFREEYGEDLGAVFEEQLDELGAPRCWLRTFRDLLVSIPAQQLEARMKKRGSSHAFVFFLALGIGSVMMTAVIGTSMFAVLLAIVAVASFAVAITSRRASKPAIALETSSPWKNFLASGGLMLVVIVALINLPPNRGQELSSVGWVAMMLSILISLSLIAYGAMLGALQVSRTRKR